MTLTVVVPLLWLGVEGCVCGGGWGDGASLLLYYVVNW